MQPLYVCLTGTYELEQTLPAKVSLLHVKRFTYLGLTSKTCWKGKQFKTFRSSVQHVMGRISAHLSTVQRSDNQVHYTKMKTLFLRILLCHPLFFFFYLRIRTGGKFHLQEGVATSFQVSK